MIDPSQYKNYILTMLFVKYASDVWKDKKDFYAQKYNNDELKLRNNGLAQQLLTGKKRLKGFSKEWKKIKIGGLIEESEIPSLENDLGKRITVKLNLKGIEKREVRGTESVDSTMFFQRKEGQFIYDRQNLHKEVFGVIPENLDGYESSQDIPSFDFKKSVNPIFFLFFLSQESISTGTGSKRIHPKSRFKKSYSFPLLVEQSEIIELLTKSDKELKLYERKLATFKEQKKGLMQKLLTGEIRVKIE